MAEETQIDDPDAAGEEMPEESGRSLLGKIKVLLFVAGVVVVECLIAYLYLPSAAETAAIAGAQQGLPEDQQLDEPDLAGRVEIDLGEFSVTAFQPVSNSTLRIDFHLFGTVALEDESEIVMQMEDNQHRFREQVLVIVRSAGIAELNDPGLGLIKRKILERSNRLFGDRISGKMPLQNIIFSDFSLIEQ